MDNEQFETCKAKLIAEAHRDGGFECMCCSTWSTFIAAIGRFEAHTPGQPGAVYLVCSDCLQPTQEQLNAMGEKFMADKRWLQLAQAPKQTH